MPVQHMVWMKFHAGIAEERINEHLHALSGLATSIPGIRHLSVGKNFSGRSNGFTHGLLVTVDDRDSLREYAAHPEHVRVATPLKEDCELIALDYEF